MPRAVGTAARALLGTLLLGTLLLAGCDDAGEGAWTATLLGSGAPFGSAVILVSGDDVMEVTGAAGTQVWTERKNDSDLRIVVVQMEASGPLTFRIRTRDLSAPRPRLAIIEIAGMDDEPLSVAPDHRFRLRR